MTPTLTLTLALTSVAPTEEQIADGIGKHASGEITVILLIIAALSIATIVGLPCLLYGAIKKQSAPYAVSFVLLLMLTIAAMTWFMLNFR